MFRILLITLTVAAGAAFSGCSKKEKPASDASAPGSTPVATRDSSSAATDAKPTAGEEETRIRFKVPGEEDADETPRIDLTAGKDTAADTKPPSVGTRTAAPAGNGDKTGNQPAEMVAFYPPFYPISKRMEGIEGRIDLSLAISEEGKVTDVDVLTATAPEFREYAVAAARDWKFTPALKDGKPTAIRASIPVPFVSEFGSGELSVYSPLAPLTYLDGTFYVFGKDGRRTPANVSVTPLMRISPAWNRPEGETDPLRVVLNFTVTEEGQVKDPQVVESSGTGFDQAALTALKYWQFVPQIRDGKPRASSVKLPIVYGTEKQAAAK